MNKPKIYTMVVSEVYPLYIQKVVRKGQSVDDLQTIIYWLTGYDEFSFQQQLDNNVDFETFILDAPLLNPNRKLITGSICGYKVQDIEDEVTQNIRYLDKLVDELAKGKALDKILREPK